MYLRLEKIDPSRNRWCWYVLSVQPTLFGEWTLSREWGRIGEGSGQSASTIFASECEAMTACDALKASKTRRGYVAQPEQLALPL